jgi:Transcriptional regulator
MEKITKELILKTAQELVETQGMEKVTLAKVGAALGISHAALYKHFKNKQDLWTSLALTWLDETLIDIFPFQTKGYTNKIDILHDWLWIMTERKMMAYKNDPVMFKLYTTYIDGNPDALDIHLHDLYNSLSTALNYSDQNNLETIMRGFTTFSSPKYADTWDSHTKSQFEQLWTIMEPGINKLLS